MGLSLGDLNPVKAIKSGFESLTGISAQRDAINSARKYSLASLEEAKKILASGDKNAIANLLAGKDATLQAINTGFEQGIGTLQPIADLFNPQGIQQGLTLEGIGSTLQAITGPDSPFAGLIQNRKSEALDALSAAGLRRSGAAAEAAAEIPTELALQISDMLFSRNVNNPALNALNTISGLQVTQGQQQGQIESDLAQSLAGIDLSGAANLANLETGAGAVQANTALGLGNLEAESRQQLLDIFGGQLTSGLQGGLSTLLSSGATGGLTAGLGSLLGFLSDERLKTNLQVINRDGPFTFYSWEWIDEVKDLNLPLMNVGLIAQDVQKIAPEHVYEVDIGASEPVLAIDYDALFEEPKKWH